MLFKTECSFSLREKVGMRESKWLSSFVYCPLIQPSSAGEGLSYQQ